MEFKSLFGLPAHPLLVHAAVVLLPLALLGALTFPWPSWRRRIGWVVVGLTAASLLSIQLAYGSGEALRDAIGREDAKAVSTHADLAATLRPWAFLFFVLVLAVMIYDERRRRADKAAGEGTAEPGRSGRWGIDRSAGMLTLCGFAIVIGLVANAWLLKVGHTGAKATWQETQQHIERGGGERGASGDRDSR